MKTLQKILLYSVSIISILGFATFAVASSLPLGGQTYYLAGSGVTSTQNTIQLTYFLTPDGTPITMSEFGTIGYGVLEPQTTSRIEDISFTGITQNSNGTATLTGVTRGVQFNYPYASSSTLMKSHAGGAQFIISNTAEFYYNEFSMQNNANVFTWPTASSSPSTKGYTDFVGSGGANIIPATTIAQGVSQLATAAQAALGTAVGSTGFNLVLPAGVATSTGGITAANHVVVANASGAIDSTFLSPALATSTQIGYLPAYQIALQRQIFSSTGTTTFSVPSGVTLFNVQVVGGGASGKGVGGCNAGTNTVSVNGDGGGAGGYANKIVNLSATTSVQVFIGSGGSAGGSGVSNPGTWSTFGTNGFYMDATGGSSNTGGVGQNGDINVQGGGGGTGLVFSNADGTGNFPSGFGGNSIFGGGAPPVNGANATGVSATAFGAGGSGPSCEGSNGGNPINSGAGAQGIVIVSW